MQIDFEKIEKHIRALILGNLPSLLKISDFPSGMQVFIQRINELTLMLSEMSVFSYNLASGNLSLATPAADSSLLSPLKALHFKLQSLCDSASLVSRGDYNNGMDYMGEISDNFNDMIAAIAERFCQCKQQIKRLEEEKLSLSHTYALLNTVLENIPEVVFVIRKSEILFKNKAASHVKKLLGDNLDENNLINYILKHEPIAEKESADYYDERLKRWYEVDITRILWKDDYSAHIFLATDVTAHKKNEQRLLKAAETDPLTKAGNRKMGIRTLSECLRQKRLFPLSISFIDLDGLKKLNDTEGHAAGDEYLKCFTAQFKKHLNQGDFLSRVGGDEFLIIMKNTTEAEALAKIRKIEKAFESYKKAQTLSTYSFSYGVLEIEEGTQATAQELIQQADMLMYKQKKQKKQIQELT